MGKKRLKIKINEFRIEIKFGSIVEVYCWYLFPQLIIELFWKKAFFGKTESHWLFLGLNFANVKLFALANTKTVISQGIH